MERAGVVSVNEDKVSIVTQCLRDLAALERIRFGRSAQDARAALARKARVSPGTVERALGNGHKVEKPALVRLVYRELQAEARRIEHDLQVLRRTGLHLGDEDIQRAEALLSELREIIG